jgi:catechol 2,3-dioxygenase-like lactoylglutathione lyase family enzyme
MSWISRRHLLLSLPAFAIAPRVWAQAAKPQLRVRGLNQMTLSVSDVKRSLDFYQGLFGMPIQARHGALATLLRIGPGPQCFALSSVAAGATPGISRYGIGVEEFNVDRILRALADHGVKRVDAAGADGWSGGPMTVRVRMRGPEAGGAAEGTPEIFLGDPSGIVVQLQDPSYCGGTGALGNVCPAPEASPVKGLLAVRDYSHFTIGAASGVDNNTFYQDVFGLQVQAYQGPTSPVLGVGPGVHFVMFTGGGAARGAGARGGATPPAAAPRGPRIDHVCFGLDTFNPDNVVKVLESYGIKPRAPGAASTPLVWYISQRMENRGGAPVTGTPELYFTDPDNIPIQLQDVKYCGGGGFLGDVCPG